MARGFDFEYVLFKSDFRYFLAGVILAVVVFAAGMQYNRITGMATRDEMIDTMIRIEGGGSPEVREIRVRPGTTVFDALKQVAYVEYRIYEDGTELTGINDRMNENGSRWTCVINGETAERIDAREVQEDDRIIFRYLKSR